MKYLFWWKMMFIFSARWRWLFFSLKGVSALIISSFGHSELLLDVWTIGTLVKDNVIIDNKKKDF